MNSSIQGWSGLPRCGGDDNDEDDDADGDSDNDDADDDDHQSISPESRVLVGLLIIAHFLQLRRYIDPLQEEYDGDGHDEDDDHHHLNHHEQCSLNIPITALSDSIRAPRPATSGETSTTSATATE